MAAGALRCAVARAALVPELVLGHVIVPTSAVRDEGTSYHYLAPAREVTAEPTAVAAATSVLSERGVPFVASKTWTTDAIYRETRARARPAGARRGASSSRWRRPRCSRPHASAASRSSTCCMPAIRLLATPGRGGTGSAMTAVSSSSG